MEQIEAKQYPCDECEYNVKQAGAELCQAQAQVDMQAEFFLQLNFGLGQHWKK
jgi:hypothetical protein